MTYNATYTETDIGPMVVDIGLKILAGLGLLAVVIGIVIVFRYFKTGKTPFK